MRRLSIAAVAVSIITFAQIASAADLPRKAPAAPPPPPPVFSWTGFYVGGTLGASWTKADASLNTVNGASPLYLVADIPRLNALGSSDFSVTNSIFGGKLGYNYQWNAIVAGLEGDISDLHFGASQSVVGQPFLPLFGGRAVFATSVSAGWLATLRGRIGYAFNRALLYATGGAAFSNVSFSSFYRGLSPLGAGFETGTGATSDTKTGWTVGGGIDYALTNNWILSAEYLHVDLGSVDTSYVVPSNGLSATMTYSAKLTSDIVRGGIAYKF